MEWSESLRTFHFKEAFLSYLSKMFDHHIFNKVDTLECFSRMKEENERPVGAALMFFLIENEPLKKLCV